VESTYLHDGLNWGRWGAEDERGALNLIDGAKVLEALAVPTQGRVLSLAIPIQREGVPVFPSRNPPLHLMSKSGSDYAAGKRARYGNQTSDSYLTVGTHGTTHVDAFAHFWLEDKMYNGFPGDAVRTDGARKGGIDKLGPAVTRGVLLDFCALHGVDHLQESHKISIEEVEAAEQAAGTQIQPGDCVLTRTGWLDVFWDDPDRFRGPEPGIGMASANFIADRGAALIGADNYGVEVGPSDPDGGGLATPAHGELLRNRGIPLMELLDLRELAAAKVGVFLFVMAPLRITGGVGSPITPLAVI
jgi:kynurenine formamidase